MLADRRARVALVCLAAALALLSLGVGGTPGALTDVETVDGNQFSAADDFDASDDEPTTDDELSAENGTITNETETNSTANGSVTDRTQTLVRR